ncbi:MAG TPA: radical SAM protein, partial [Candidatus Baltobacteraceae bacterium]|nr:radical SAM protein [Candidatus Baltobacteraceae bacterium]
MISQFPDNLTASAPAHAAVPHDSFEHPRDFLENQFVYLVISSRARGLSVGVNVNPVTQCTFNCLYCEVDRKEPPRAAAFDVDRMAMELRQTLRMAHKSKLRLLPKFARVPQDLLEVRHVALSGDGEPTLSKHFTEALQAVVHLRAVDKFFKIVVITNSTALDQPAVAHGLKLLTRDDEIWAKLDGGTQQYIERINGATVSLEKIMRNILRVG